jgi:MbtH protein
VLGTDDDSTVYDVVVNDEEQFSIWPARKSAPAGWKAVGFQGTKAECMSHIDQVWIDLRPRSLRERLGS